MRYKRLYSLVFKDHSTVTWQTNGSIKISFHEERNAFLMFCGGAYENEEKESRLELHLDLDPAVYKGEKVREMIRHLYKTTPNVLTPNNLSEYRLTIIRSNDNLGGSSGQKLMGTGPIRL